ncbi:peroxiredoxin [Lentimonas sp. CC11]|uniref:peroxiredoxin n=2 Tax=Lentimonas TaxID=417293 RepID=UPI001328094F|nr:peroxiredoxin [Lentimonas sp. CC11]CAA6691997.1 Thiol peroxidase, Bcp-type (EC [Lentimonas sp. CC10]CAA6694058.1 Thiol peroxidase, Bcp-type (EC [Lentimonas sp. CC19]CAA7070302.1 Thiol peroxidase, Bcp-type (EC [Lentimonas sp. CC11]
MKHSLILIMLISLVSTLSAGDALEVGATAPQIQAVDQTGATIDLGAALNTGTTVVFFYPRAMTPGCTKQACSLRDSWEVLKERGVTIFGVSTDSAERQQQFIDKYELPYTLIADTDKVVSKAFGRGGFSRQAYIFIDGTLVWRDLKAATADQGDEVLAALDAIQASAKH